MIASAAMRPMDVPAVAVGRLLHATNCNEFVVVAVSGDNRSDLLVEIKQVLTGRARASAAVLKLGFGDLLQFHFANRCSAKKRQSTRRNPNAGWEAVKTGSRRVIRLG